MIKNVDCS